jgi:hypothetical protein
MNKNKIETTISCLEELNSYKFKEELERPTIQKSNPQETIVNMFNDLKTKIPNLEQKTFNELIKNLLQKNVDDNPKIGKHEIDIIEHNTGLSIRTRISILKFLLIAL